MTLAKDFRDCGARRAGLILSLLVLLLASASSAFAQNNQSQGLKMSDLLKLPGRVIAEGANTNPTGRFRAAKYRVEEVALPSATEVKINDRILSVNKAYRVTVVGGPFEVRAMPAVIWINDAAVGYGVENEDLTEITAVTFDESLIVEGASIFLSYGDKKNKEDRAELPEKLKLGSAKGGRQ
ncbi:MAG TPA: hypothetical protein VJS44_12630 [Pyrinomonadaceae bacterium]|nr:hypothetical protein [Pyrinomonadaceae bacterium]